MENKGIDVEPLGDGVSIHLPHRILGPERKIGWLALLVGTIGAGFMLCWIATPVSWGIGLLLQNEMFGFLFILFGCTGLIGLFPAVKTAVLGIAILKNRTHCTVTVADSKIVSKNRFGWFSFKSKLKTNEIEQLFVAPVSTLGSSEDAESGKGLVQFVENFLGGEAHRLFLITNKKRGGKFIAPFYPKNLLETVANTISTELNRDRAKSILVVRDASDFAAKPLAAVKVSELKETDEEPELTLPDDTAVEVSNEGGSTVFRIRERTAWAGSGGLFFFAIVWNGILSLITMSMFKAGGGGADWIMIGGISVFWLVGIGLFVGAIYIARQSALIGVKEGLLFIERKTIFGTKWTEFAAEDIESIEMDKSNMEVNDVPVMNLRITPKEGKPAAMFSQLKNEELKWLAQQLRNELGIQTASARLSAATFDADAPLVEPKNTDIQVDQRVNGVSINVPPWHFEGSRELRIVSIVFMSFPIPLAALAVFLFGAEFFILFFGVAATVIGGVMFLVHKFLTTRCFRIDVDPESIDVDVSGFLLQRQFSLGREEVRDVEVVDSDTKVNNRRMYCVRVSGDQGRAISMMTGRPESELLWVAQLIHKQLKLKEHREQA